MMPAAMTDEDSRATTGSRLTEPLSEGITRPQAKSVTLPAEQPSVPPTSIGRSSRLGVAAFDARYEHKDVLGRGGMGEVHLSLDRRIGREVAMKIVKPDVAHREDLMMRFEREAKIQGRLEHPMVVPVHDLGLRPDGSVFFTMKRVRGMTLEAIIDGLKAGTPDVAAHFTLRRVLGALSDLCLGIAFAHSRGVIHRDLKPANVILGEFGEVHVLDWGIAKVLDADSDVAEESVRALAPLPETPLPAPDSLETLVDEIPKTRAGAAMGTPGYMSPEQMRGRPVDARSDIYALGCMIFEAVTLEPLHPRDSVDTLRRSTLDGLSDARPSARVSGRNIPPELDVICVRATQVEERQRYRTARELHDALEAYLAGDRDEERRAALAADRIESARKVLDSTTSAGELSARVNAIRELTAAISLRPDDPEALRLLARALTDAPETLPPEAEAALVARRGEQRRQSAQVSFLGLGVVLLILPFFATLGVRSYPALLLLFGCVLCFTLFSYWLSRTGGNTSAHILGSAVLGASVAGTTSVVLGPLVLVPTAACVIALAVIVNSRAEPRRRYRVVAIASAAVLVPFGLQLLGVLPASYAFDAAGMRILPWATHLPEGPTLFMLLLGSLACLFVPAFAVGRAIDVLSHAERQIFAQAWQLRQLLPDPKTSVPPSAKG